MLQVVTGVKILERELQVVKGVKILERVAGG